MRDVVVDLDGGARILPSGTIIKPGNAMFVQSWLCVHDPEGSIDTSALPARADRTSLDRDTTRSLQHTNRRP